MAKKSIKTDEPEEQEPPVEIAGGSGGNTGMHPLDPADLETSQHKAGHDKSIGGGPREDVAPKKEKARG